MISRRYKELQNRYGDQFVAINNGRIIGHNQKLETLKQYLNERKIGLASVMIEYIPKKGIVVLY